jgi:hypothetical protein
MRGAEEQTSNWSGDLRLVGASLVALLQFDADAGCHLCRVRPVGCPRASRRPMTSRQILAEGWRLTKTILALFSRGSLK